jgi:adenylyltransferase/sulfurtransferase
LGTIVSVIAALEASEAFKILLDQRDALLRSLVMVDVWYGDFERAHTQRGKGLCPVCDEGQYELLEAEQGSVTTVLCGRSAVQVSPRPAKALNLPDLAQRLGVVGQVQFNEHLLRFDVGEAQLTLFRDGRAIVKGVDDPAKARALYARYIGI